MSVSHILPETLYLQEKRVRESFSDKMITCYQALNKTASKQTKPQKFNDVR